jgi:hypothetical protein
LKIVKEKMTHLRGVLIGSAIYLIWISPPEGLMKLNVDVAIAKGMIERVVAIICRSDKELIMEFIYINDQRTIGPDNGML